MRQNISLAVATVACFGLAASPGLADTVDLSGVVNNDLTTYTNGGVYPQTGGPITIGGINFNLSTLPSGHTGVAQLVADPGLGGPQSFTIPVNISGAGVVYTIVNSSFGSVPNYAGQITFNGLLGETFTYTYIEGDNIRDHATTFFNTSAPNVFATDDFGSGDRLDVQKIILPGTFAGDSITSIVFSYVVGPGFGDTSPGDGEAFLAAVTTAPAVAAVPEPSTWAMMLIGFAALGYMTLRRKLAPAIS